MDGGQRRVPTGRRVINGSEQPAYQQPQAPQQAAAAAPTSSAPAATVQHTPHRTSSLSTTSTKQPTPSRFKKPLIILIAAVLIGVAGWFGWSALQSGADIDSGKYQAVFFTNGQVYFGKLTKSGSEQMKLTDVFYLQAEAGSTTDTTSQNPQTTSTNSNNVQLIKLGEEIHGPEDEMIISKNQVLFYENLKADSRVSQSIRQYKSSK
jgi:hypothetical protein